MSVIKNKIQKTLTKEPSFKFSSGLPDEVTPAVTSVAQARTLIYSPPGWGKTEFFMSNPNCLLLACEEGHKFTRGYKVIIDCWDGPNGSGSMEPYKDDNGVVHSSFVRAVANLQTDKKYNFVFIDTVDALVKMLLDFTLGKAKADHASDIGEYGKGWDIAQNTPFRKQFMKLVKTGKGIGASTHEQAENKTFKSGTYAKKETSLPAGIYKQIYANFDLILHGIFGKKRKENRKRDRILESEGSENALAKNRGGLLPAAFIVPQKFEDRWKQFEGFFLKPETKETALKEYEKAGYSID